MPVSLEQDLAIKLEKQKQAAAAQFFDGSKLGLKMQDWKAQMELEQSKIISDSKGYLPKDIKKIRTFLNAYSFVLKDSRSLDYQFRSSEKKFT